MPRKVERGINLFIIFLLAALLGKVILSFPAKEILPLPIFIVTMGFFLIIIVHQKWIKYNTPFQQTTDLKWVIPYFLVFIGCHILLKNSFLIIEIQSLILILLSIIMDKEFRSEKYLILLFSAITCLYLHENLLQSFYLLVATTCIFTLEKIDSIAFYRKKNILIVIASECVLAFFTLINYHFLYYVILFFLFLSKKLPVKAIIKISMYGMLPILLLILFWINGRISPWRIDTISMSNLLLLEIILITLYIHLINFFIYKKIDNKLINFVLLGIIMTSVFIPNNIYSLFSMAILLSMLLSYTIHDFPRIVDRKTRLIDKSHQRKNNKEYKKVSVVIPNYNYADYLVERINSVLFQSYPISELIILDDVSKDNSVEVIKKELNRIKEAYPDLKTDFIPNEKNSGNVFRQWKKCFEVSTGDYLWICEADDSASPYFLENVMKAFEQDEEVILSYSESLTMDQNNNILMNNLREWIDIYQTDKWSTSFIEDGKEFNKEYLVVNNVVANVSGAVFHKKKGIHFEKYLIEAEDYKLAGDWYFYEKILDFGKIAYCHKSLNYHRMHSSSVTLTTKREKEYEEIVRIQNDMQKRYTLSEETKNKIIQRRNKMKQNYGFSDEELSLDKIEWERVLKGTKEEILLSIIIPVYNTEKYLEKCLDSVLTELPPKAEVIIINDGSTDSSEKIIKRFQKNHDNTIKYFKRKNCGLSATKNFGIAKAQGKYIGFVDSDDYVKNNMFSCMLKEALLKEADIVYCDVEMVYEDGRREYRSAINQEVSDDLMKLLDMALMPASWSKIVKKELFTGLDYPEEYNNEDIAVTPILLARSKNTVTIPTPFYKYLQRSGSIQNSGFSQKRFVAFDTAEICFARIKEFDSKTQEKIKGTIYTNQLLSLLLYPIKQEKNNEKRLEYIRLFCNRWNQFTDAEENQYVQEYIKIQNYPKILEYIKEEKVKQINRYLNRKR